MTQVWLEEVRTSRWTSRWTSSRTSGGTSGSTSGSQMDPGRVKYESGIIKGGFNWSLRMTSRNISPNLLLRAQNLKVYPRSFELDINASPACFKMFSIIFQFTFCLLFILMQIISNFLFQKYGAMKHLMMKLIWMKIILENSLCQDLWTESSGSRPWVDWRLNFFFTEYFKSQLYIEFKEMLTK